jgi:DNA transformation protein
MKGETFKDYILDHLSDLPELRAKRMFGGYGLYAGEDFFGIVYEGRCYLKTDAGTRQKFVEHGMQPFRPNAKQTLTAYYEVPEEVMERCDEFTRWALEALRCRGRLTRRLRH